MDKKKLFEKIKENKKEQAKKYYVCMNKIISSDMNYYKDKEYAKYFISLPLR